MPRPLADIESDIQDYCRDSEASFARYGFTNPTGDIWVLKFIPSKYLADFMAGRELRISNTSGYTWGDGVYVVPLDNPYSTMMYGRIGIMGRVASRGLTYWDGVASRGVDLFQEWIPYRPAIYRHLTSTVHSARAARVLRNAFKRRFRIDLVFFPPDEYNIGYVDPARDVWFVISDAPIRGSSAPSPAAPSTRVRDCRWVATVEEEFGRNPNSSHFVHYLGRHLSSTSPAHHRPPLNLLLERAWRTNAPLTIPA